MAIDKVANEGAVDLTTVLLKQNEIIAQQSAMIGALHKSIPPREIRFDDPEYQAQIAKDRRAFKTPTYQNGFDADASGLTDETIDRISKLRAGTYIHGTVTILVGARGAIWFKYANKTQDQRMARQEDFRSLTELVNKIWAEMEATAPKATLTT